MILIMADVHINDYANYNYSNKSRLNQFKKLAEVVIDIAKKNGCTEIWILGDIVDKPNSRPYILHKAKEFLNLLCEEFIVRYILGNHDFDSKSTNLSIDDTQITLFDNKNLIYMDKEILEMNGHRFGFMNWYPDQNLDWVEGHLDVLFGHYTKSELFGQEIDESKFDLMIHGDIHNSQIIGKFVSACNPIQKDMSSEAEGKVLLFDPETLEYKRIPVDPDHINFLRMSYTQDKAREGFQGPLQYNIFKPLVTDNDTGRIDRSFDWDNLDDLINKVCLTNGLTEVHSEVLSKCDLLEEIDFNFQLNKLVIHGYRSIQDLEIDFSQGDRIALLGMNGSGKSSIIRALQSIFGKNSELKYEQSDFTDDVYVKLTLTYQNKVYEITKGSSWGLTIDGQEQSYHGIRDFEDDLKVKLPFSTYSDIIFFNSDVSEITSKFNSNRRIHLISKFYRLDRIDSYNSTAWNLYRNLEQELNDVKNDINVNEGILNHIKKRLTELEEYKDKSIDEYKSELSELQELKSIQKQHSIWLSTLSNLESDKRDAIDKLSKINSKLTFDCAQGKIDLNDLKTKLVNTNTRYEETYNNSIEFESTLKEIETVESDGTKLRDSLNKLKEGICPECGASLQAGKSKQLIDEKSKELDKLGERWDNLDKKLSSHPKGRDSKEYYINLLKDLKASYEETSKSVELLNNKILNYTKSESEKSVIESLRDSLEEKIKAHRNTEPKSDKKLPVNASELEMDIISNISKCEEYASQLESLEKYEIILKDLNKTLDEKSQILNKYDSYISITAINGDIYYEVLKLLADKFSSSDIKYEVASWVSRGNRVIDFNAYYLVKDKFRMYESCSSGQRTLCDLDFLDKLFNVNLGVLVLDEYLKHLDDNNFARVCDILTNMNVNTILLSTHDDNLTTYTKRLLLNLDENGRTQLTVN